MIMKYFIIALLLSLNIIPSYSQNFNYEIKDLKGQYYCDWIGNTFPAQDFVPGSKTSANKAFGFEHMPFQMHIIFVSPDGTVFSNGHSSERGFHGIAIKDQQIIVNYSKNAFNSGGYCVTANDDHVFLGREDKASGKFGVTRYNRETGEYASFSNGVGEDQATIETGSQPAGITISGDQLLVADSAMNQVKIYNLSDLSQSPAATFAVPDPGYMVTDRNGLIWIQDRGNHKIIAYKDEEKCPQEILLPAALEPMGMAIDNQNRLLLCDGGPDQNIKVYGNISSSPELVQEIGQKGGIMSGEPGKTGHLKLIHPGGVGVDANDNIYILQNTSGGHEAPVLQVFSPDLELLWETAGTEFVTVADVDPRDETRLISPNIQYRYDYDGEIGRAWQRESILGTNEAHHTAFVRYVNDKKMMFTLHTAGTDLDVYHLNEHRAELFTSIENGRGADIDHENGTVWTTHEDKPLRKYTVTGTNEKGLPAWDSGTEIPLPAPFNDVRRIMYDQKNDDMYLVGYTDQYPYDEDFGSTQGYWKKAGRYLAKYSNWSGNKKLEWGFHTPWCDGCDREVAQSVEEEGDYIFLVVGSKAKTSDPRRRPIIFVYRKSNGSLVGTMQPGGNINDRAMVDMTHSMNVHLRENGEYLIILEDCAYAKNILIRWTPDVRLGAAPEFDLNKIKIYPNPVDQSHLTLEVPTHSKINFMDLQGRSLLEETASTAQILFSTTGFKPGIYLVQVLNSGKYHTRKVMIKN